MGYDRRAGVRTVQWRLSRGLICAVFSVAVVVTLVAVDVNVPARAAESDADCSDGSLMAVDEHAASVLAAECGRAVEVEQARGVAQRQFAESDGSLTLESYAVPRWAPDSAGKLVEADPTLRVDGSGVISTAATVVGVEVSPGGTGPMVTATDVVGRSIGLVWPEVLPEPVLDGATATYRDVFDDVDLQVMASVDGFSYALVVHTQQAARSEQLAKVDIAISGVGLEIVESASGGVAAVDESGEVVFSTSEASMWDSSVSTHVPPLAEESQRPLFGASDLGMRVSDVPGAEPGRVAPVGVELHGGVLRVSPDTDMLSDGRSDFPVTIDPTFSGSRLAWTTVADGKHADDTWWNNAAWPRVDGLRMGYLGWIPESEQGYGVWRSMARFDTEAIRGATVNSAEVGVTVYHTGGCDPQPLQLWSVEGELVHDAVPTSWNSTSAGWQQGAELQEITVPSANSTGDWCAPNPDRDVEFEAAAVRSLVQARADAGESSTILGLRAGDESDMMQWTRAYEDSFVLSVNYTPVVAVPTSLETDGVGCLAPEGSRVAGSAPVLTGVPRNSEGSVRAQIEVWAIGGSQALRSWSSQPVATADPVWWQVDEALVDGQYRWRMRSQHPDTGSTSAWSGWCEFVVDVTLDEEPAPEVVADLECPVGSGEPMEAADEALALLAARACDLPVEAVSEREFNLRVYAQPGGELLAEQYTQPQWAYDSEGDWVEADTTLVSNPDGSITTAATVSHIEVSPGGSGALVKATDPDGGWMSLTWPDPLPAPTLDGNTATYSEVFTDTDLRITAGVDGFSYVLVVKSAAAASSQALDSVSVDIATDGLDVLQDSDGTVVVRDPAGDTVFSSPAAYMWDSSQVEDPEELTLFSEEEGSGDPESDTPGRFTQMPLQLDGVVLTVEPDEDLLSDPEAEFPVLIDPPFSGKRLHWATVHQNQPGRGWSDDSNWPRKGGMRVGNLQYWPGWPCGDACGLWRSAIRFDIKKLSGRQVVSASVKATQTHTSGCGSYGLQLWYVTAFTSGTSWNGLSNKWQDRLQTRSVASSNSSGGCSGSTPSRGVTFDNSAVRSRVQSHANAGHNSLSFGFRSSDESSKHAYRRIAVGSVKLEVEYNRQAQTPTSLSTDGKGCSTSSPGPWLTTQRPTLSGKPRDPDGRVGAHLQIRRVGSSSTHYSWKSGTNRKHNTVVNHRIPSSKKLASGDYRWRMRSIDSHPSGSNSSWRQWCYFRVDVTSPTTPTVEVVGGDPPQAGEQVTLRLRSSDAHSGLNGFAYGINEEVKREFTSSAGETTISFTTDPSGGLNLVYVWSRDNAGNYSNRAVFDVFAMRFVEATPAAAWRLDGDGVDDSGQGHELTLGNGVEWENDAGLSMNRSLGFDGTGCVSAPGPVVRLDAEYTIAAWVRLDDKSTDRQIMSPAGQARGGFYFKYQQSTDKWYFTLPSADARENVSWATIRSTDSAQLGQWTHLAVRVDPAARHIQFYVNGSLDGERNIPHIPWHTDGDMQVGCAARTSGYTWYHMDGAIHHAALWQGLLTPDQIQAAYNGELPAGPTGDWRLRGDGADGSDHARDLTIAGGQWVDDQFGRRSSALHTDGSQWAELTPAVVRTDQSFSVSAWTKLDDKTDFRTVVSQTGTTVAGFNLNYNPSHDRWQISMPSQDGTSWHRAQSTQSPETGRWYHLLGVFDHADSEIRLYVDGKLQTTSPGPATPWHDPNGELLIGATGFIGERANPMVGTVSDVTTWRGALTDQQATEVYGGNPAVEALSRWNLNGDGTDDLGSSGLTVVGDEFIDYEWVEDRDCFPWSALGLRLSGQAHAHTTGPVLTTDESFTVTAWAKLDSLGSGPQTILSQSGENRSAFRLQVTPEGRWRFAMPHQDALSANEVVAESAPGTAIVGDWTHLAAVFDLANGELRLYVDGDLVDTGTDVDSPWQGSGPFYVGASIDTAGMVSQHTYGAVDSVSTWVSTLAPARIAELALPSPFGGIPCSL